MAIKEAVEVIYSLVDKTKAGFRSMSEGFDKASKKADELKERLENIGRVGKTLAIGAGAVAGAFSLLGGASLKLAGQAEQQRIAFKGLLGSYEEADIVIKRIRQEAARTPFDIPGLTAMTQQLTTVTKDGNKAVDILLDIGDAIATSGKGVDEMQRVILNIQQVASAGKLTAMDIRQFQGAIPVFNDIVATLGLTTQELQDSGDAANLLFKAFGNAAKEGGLALGGLANQSRSFNGQVSTLQDNFGGLIRQLGEGLLPIATPIVGLFNKLLDRFQNLSPEIKTLAAVFVTSTIALSGLAVTVGVTMAALPILAAGFAAVGVSASVALAGIPILITAVAGGVILLKNNIEKIKTGFLNLVDTIKIAKNNLFGLNVFEKMQNAELEKQIENRNKKLELLEKEKEMQEDVAKASAEAQRKARESLEAQLKTSREVAAQKKKIEEEYLDFFMANQADQTNALKIGANAYLDVEKKKYMNEIQAWMAKETAIAAGELAVFNPMGLLRLVGVGAAGAGVAAINSIQLAKGGSFVVDSPTRIGPATAGEIGQKERVTVQPLSRSDRDIGGGGSMINLTVKLGEETIAKKVMKAGFAGRTERTIDDGIIIN